MNAFVIRRNISQLLPLICKGLSDSFHKEFYIIYQSNSQKIIELMQNVVVKCYFSKADFPAKLEKIYHMMDDRQVPYVNHIVQINKKNNEKMPNIIFSLKGLVYRPSSMKQLVIALYCVLSALKVFIFLRLFIVLFFWITYTYT